MAHPKTPNFPAPFDLPPFCGRRRQLRQFAAAFFLMAVLLTSAGCQEGDYVFFYVVAEEEKTDDGNGRIEYFKDEKFDADKIVEDIWDSRIMPTIIEKAIDLPVLLEALAADPEAAGQQYGYREEGGDYPWNFIVKAEARVVAINTRSRKGTLSIDVEPYDGKADAMIWIGPIITSYSVRDSLDFISFTTGVVGASGVNYTFDTQVQFAELSNSLNRRGNQNILAALEPVMCFKVSEYTLERLKKKEVPEDVIGKLENMQDVACTSQEELWEAVKDRIREQAEEYQELIWKYVDTSDTLQDAFVRVYGAITQDKSGKIMITPVQLEILEEEQP